MTTISNLTPFIPSDKALANTDLPDKAVELSQASAKLSGHLSHETRETLVRHMRVINSYYSNLIEGNATKPYEIRAAQEGKYSDDPAKRDLQEESLGHMYVQEQIRTKDPSLDEIFTPEFIKNVHSMFYHQIPQSLWKIKNESGEFVGEVVPGEWRKQDVTVGRHIPPEHCVLNNLMDEYCKQYHSGLYKGDKKILSIMAAHHRFAWIHPLMDGNGRVGRLLTDTILRAIGLDSCGVWCLSRGLANTSKVYKAKLSVADHVRQGDFDGRGLLTEKGLVSHCAYMIDTALDQVDYMSRLLDLTNFRKRVESYIQARNDFRVLGVDAEIKPVAGLILQTAFIQGELPRSQAIELCGMPERSARRLLSQLKKEGLLSETSTKSPLRWEIPEHAEPWYFPDLAPTRGM